MIFRAKDTSSSAGIARSAANAIVLNLLREFLFPFRLGSGDLRLLVEEWQRHNLREHMAPRVRASSMDASASRIDGPAEDGAGGAR